MYPKPTGYKRSILYGLLKTLRYVNHLDRWVQRYVKYFQLACCYVLAIITLLLVLYSLLCFFGLLYFGNQIDQQQVLKNAYSSGGVAICTLGYYFIARRMFQRSLNK